MLRFVLSDMPITDLGGDGQLRDGIEEGGLADCREEEG